jgi:peptidoglycan/xylan/chitin deacetylase (PgdA/CDA1 family)
MSWRAKIRQQLLQFRDPNAHSLRAKFGAFSGLLPLILLLMALGIGFILFSRASQEAAAQSEAATSSPASSPSSLAQMATRTATRGATPTAISTRRAAASSNGGTATPTQTPTKIAEPTATQIAVSPLVIEVVTPTQVVPFSTAQPGPQLAPVDVITTSESISPTLTPTFTVEATAVPTATLDVLQWLIPTPTPTPTLTINEALEQPVKSGGGLAGIVATATAAITDQTDGDEPVVTEAQPGAIANAVMDTIPASETEVETGDEVVDFPTPEPTVASQPTPDGVVRTAHVPVLMYHYLSEPPANADIYRIDLSVAPDLFAAHLDAIQQAGYTTISLYNLVDHLTQGAPLPEKPVVLTFDDGYRDNYTNAFPLLRERGLTATFFIVTDFIYDQRPEYLTWDMVREMYAAGMSIEGHGRNHVSLANKDRDYLIWQALGTYEAIEYEIGVRPRFISYPAGEYDALTLEIFRSANYWAGFTTKQGATHSSDNLFELRRIRVRGNTTPEELLRLLALDW